MEPGTGYRNLPVDEVVEVGRVRNYLHREGIMTVADIIRCLTGEKTVSRGSLTEITEKVIYESLYKLRNRPAKPDRGMRMFEHINGDYMELPIWELAIFVKDSRIIRKLVDKGYNTVGDLDGTFENDLESIVGQRPMEKLRALESTLTKPSESVLSLLWKDGIRSRRGTIIRKRAEGKSNHAIAKEEGVSHQRISSLAIGFFAGQESYLFIVEKKIEDGTDIDELFDETDKGIFLVWRAIRNARKLRRTLK